MITKEMVDGVRKSSVRIEEREGGWEITRAGSVETQPTAAEALESVKTLDRIMAEAGFSMFTVVEWVTHTPIGRSVVLALQ